MATSRRKAWDYAEELLSVPSRSVPVTLRRGKNSVVLLHKGRVVTRCYNTEVGRWGARFMAESLGVDVPAPGHSITTSVSTGVLFRAISISSLDLRKVATHAILGRMLEEAQFQRTSAGGATT